MEEVKTNARNAVAGLLEANDWKRGGPIWGGSKLDLAFHSSEVNQISTGWTGDKK